MELLVQHLLATAVGMVVVALAISISVLEFAHWRFPNRPSATPIATAVISIMVASMFSVLLGNLFGIKRDRDGREWGIRQQHLSQLEPVLRQESAQIAGLASDFHDRGFVEGEHGGVRMSTLELAPFFEPNLMSFDLTHHYPDYVRSKERLATSVADHDQRFVAAVAEARKELRFQGVATISADALATTFILQCTGKGPGFTMEVHPGSYSYSVFGQGVGGGGAPPAEVTKAFRLYQAFKPAPELRGACYSLRVSAADIEAEANDLSKRALLLTQETFLRGSCEFVQGPVQFGSAAAPVHLGDPASVSPEWVGVIASALFACVTIGVIVWQVFVMKAQVRVMTWQAKSSARHEQTQNRLIRLQHEHEWLLENNKVRRELLEMTRKLARLATPEFPWAAGSDWDDLQSAVFELNDRLHTLDVASFLGPNDQWFFSLKAYVEAVLTAVLEDKNYEHVAGVGIPAPETEKSLADANEKSDPISIGLDLEKAIRLELFDFKNRWDAAS